MSIKNQNRFTIFASLILGVAILAFVTLNLLVDKISKMSHAQVTQQTPGKGPRPVGFTGQGTNPDDEYKENANANGEAPGQLPNAPGKPSKANGSPDTPGSSGAMRRVNNGKNGTEFEQKPQVPAAAKPSTPVQQPDMRQGPPAGYPDPSRMSPEERDAFEREMFRRQQMMQPDYDYPPPEYYQYEDDYDPGYRGQKTDAKSLPVKLSDSARSLNHREDDEEEYDPDDYLEDDFE